MSRIAEFFGFSPAQPEQATQNSPYELVLGDTKIKREIFEIPHIADHFLVLGEFVIMLDRIHGKVKVFDNKNNAKWTLSTNDFAYWLEIVGQKQIFFDLYSNVDTQLWHLTSPEGIILSPDDWDRSPQKGTNPKNKNMSPRARDYLREDLGEARKHNLQIVRDESYQIVVEQTRIKVKQIPSLKDNPTLPQSQYFPIEISLPVQNVQTLAIRTEASGNCAYFANSEATKLKSFTLNNPKEITEQELPQALHGCKISDILFGHLDHKERPFLQDMAIINARDSRGASSFHVIYLPTMDTIFSSPTTFRALGFDLSGDIRAIHLGWSTLNSFRLKLDQMQSAIAQLIAGNEAREKEKQLEALASELHASIIKNPDQKGLLLIQKTIHHALLTDSTSQFYLARLSYEISPQNSPLQIQIAAKEALRILQDFENRLKGSEHARKILGRPLTPNELKTLLTPYREPFISALADIK